MNIHQWAARWGVPAQALEELFSMFGALSTEPPGASVPAPGSEAMAQSLIRLEATQKGARLFRNNVGAGKLEDGSYLRWGLANDSPAVNALCKSSDLIGISGEIITAADVGQRRGRFIAREVKRPGWTYSATEREQAQLRFIQLITAYGGNASFATGPGTL